MATGYEQHHVRLRAMGVYILLLVAAIGIAAVVSFTYGREQSNLNSFPKVTARPPYVPAPDPITAVGKGLLPSSTDQQPGRPSTSIRAIEVFPTHISLVAGGKVARHVPLPHPVTTLPEVVSAIGDTTWISMPKPGTVLVRAALIVEPQSRLFIRAPVRTVQLQNLPGVFLGARSAQLHIAEVHVETAGKPGNGVNPYSPFVIADYASTMDINRSVFSGLGWDWNGSYGVSWMAGSTGKAVDSTFEHGFIGVYTDHVTKLVLQNDTYVYNRLYGLDPHSFSSRLRIFEGLAAYNGRHGIIFSNHVTNSNIAYVVTRDNGENGIMMDAESTGNVIEYNKVSSNHGDGIVTSNSPDNIIGDNTVENNRVGIHVSGSSPSSEHLVDNTVTENALASQGVSLRNNNEYDNGGQFIDSRLKYIWVVAAGAYLWFVLVTARLRRSHQQSIATV